MATPKAAHAYLSKSLYMSGLQCQKALWLHKYRPELKDDVSESQQAVFDAGTDVGILAQQLFPGGVLVPYESLTHAQQLAMTQAELRAGASTIYEATFSYDHIFVKVDILNNGPQGWELYEVKASTDLKEHYLDDIALQVHVLNGAGIPLTKACLVHVNNQYVRDGEIDVHQLFTLLDVTEVVKEKQAAVRENIETLRSMLRSDMPEIDIGPYCEDPYACPFCGHCWAHVPEDSVFELRGQGRPDPFELYRHGILKIEAVPEDLLGWRQQMQRDGLLHQKDYVDANAVREFLKSLWYPLCFLDFETTYMVPVPMYNGTRPYQQVPFQYSLHVQTDPGAELQHFEFLADGRVNPQQELLNRLLDDLHVGACVLAWNKTFEEQRLRELADAFPDKREAISSILANMRDLMAPFRARHIYLWQFNGSYSIKAVLPAMVGGMSYEALPINNGEMASTAWLRMIHATDTEEKQTIRRRLLEYCRLDTYGMVKILVEMRKLA